MDVSSWRFRDQPATVALAAADLAGLGHVVVGRHAVPADLPVPVALTAGRTRARRQRHGGWAGCRRGPFSSWRG